MIEIKLIQLLMSMDWKQNNLKQQNSKTQDLIRQSKCSTQSNILNINNNGGWMKQQLIRLQKQAKAEKQKRQQIETKYQSFKERLIHRQQEFYRILQKFNVTKQYPTRTDLYIQQIHRKILCTFDDFNVKARQLLDDRYSQVYRMMQRRVDILMQKMDKQLGKYRKTSVQERKEILQSIREITAIAAQTQNENIAFRKINSQLTLKLQMLNDEKKLMLQQIVTLKSYISKLSNRQKQLRSKSVLKHDDISYFDPLQLTKMDIIKTQQFTSARQSTLKVINNNRYDERQLMMSNMRGFSTMRTIDFARTGGSSLVTNQQNTISHLKQCLVRERNKNLQLVKFTLELETKIQKIISLITTNQNNNDRIIKELFNRQNCFNTELLEVDNNYNGLQSSVLEGESQKNKDKLQKMLGQERQQQFDYRNKLQQLIAEINKILHLPQRSSSGNCQQPITTYQAKQPRIQAKHSSRYYQKEKRGNSQVEAKTPNSCRRRLGVRKEGETSRSIVLNKAVSKKKQHKKQLAHPPQELIIQGGSIEIK